VIRLMLSAFQSVMPAQLDISQIMSFSDNFLKDALSPTLTLALTLNLVGYLMLNPIKSLT